jgi:3-(3-hydroxy-phenyl)propionate hydroxylase
MRNHGSDSIVIIGAGPSGMTAALFLARQGLPVTVLERETEIFEDPRAATFHPPTLEMFAPTGITQNLHESGIVVPKWQYRDRRGGLVAEWDLSILADETPYPYRLQCEQHKLVRMLREKLADFPNAAIRYHAGVSDVRQIDGHVEITAAGETIRAAYVIGADGGRSVVRKTQDISFEGFTYLERFLVITTNFDFAEAGFVPTVYMSDPQEWTALFKVPGKGPPGPGLWRVVFPVVPEGAEEELLSFARAEQRLQSVVARRAPYEILHTNLYQVHQRVAGSFRKGRVVLVGDAAHINNPLGGMGMNFGLHDAINLAEKLGALLRGEAAEDVLDRYDRQRRHVANAFLQAMTIQNKKMMEERDPQVRDANQEELRQIVSDRGRAHAFLLRTAMIEGVRAAAAIP